MCKLVTGGCGLLQHSVHRDCDVKSVVPAHLLKVSRISLKLVIITLRMGVWGEENYYYKSECFLLWPVLKSNFSLDEVKSYDFFFLKKLYFS